jgi:hypothetical protein
MPSSPMPDADDDPEVQVSADTVAESGRPTRERKQTARYEPTFLITSDGTCYNDYLSLAASAVPFFHDAYSLSYCMMYHAYRSKLR